MSIQYLPRLVPWKGMLIAEAIQPRTPGPPMLHPERPSAGRMPLYLCPLYGLSVRGCDPAQSEAAVARTGSSCCSIRGSGSRCMAWLSVPGIWIENHRLRKRTHSDEGRGSTSRRFARNV